ncbi:hypothetical protein OAB57_02320 [Bacteriovoracaceae bacterium]|nr:hypothetical protein [Bacteriovoracaceae bacterium]
MRKIYLILLLLGSGCIDDSIIGVKSNTCYEETNKKLEKAKLEFITVYKVEKINNRGNYMISRYYNRSWIYQGEKSSNYFDEKEYFKYKKIVCPDFIDTRGGLNDQLKNMAFDKDKKKKKKKKK